MSEEIPKVKVSKELAEKLDTLAQIAMLAAWIWPLMRIFKIVEVVEEETKHKDGNVK